VEEALLPRCMPVDAKQYAGNFSQVNFLNAYYQIRDVLTYHPEKILIIGVGVGLEPLILRHKFRLDVCSLDIDCGFEPDCVGSVHNMKMFYDQQFDVVIASHVLEHLPFSFFRTCLEELARVAKHAVVYLPYAGRNLEWKFTWAQHCREYGFRVHLPPLRWISGQKPELQDGQHYWECGIPGFSKKKISSTIEMYFQIDKMYQNQDWKNSMNFLLTSKYKKHLSPSGTHATIGKITGDINS
jgi:hypothetical protein